MSIHLNDFSGKETSMIEFRDATYYDLELIFMLKKASLQDSIDRTWGWEDQWQRDYLIKNFMPEQYKIIRYSNQDCGCLSISNKLTKININLLLLAPKYQNKGIGTYILNKILFNAQKERKIVDVRVLKTNSRAYNLYKRLGFKNVKETNIKFYLEY